MSIKLTDLEFSILQNISSSTLGWRIQIIEENNLSLAAFNTIIQKLISYNLVYILPLTSKAMGSYGEKVDDNYYLTPQGEEYLENNP